MLREEIKRELNESVKAKDSLTASVLRGLLSEVYNREKREMFKEKRDKERPLSDEEVIEVVASEAKKRREAISIYEKAGAETHTEREKAELAILTKYLPEQLSTDELRTIIEKTIKEAETKEMGRVISSVMSQVKGRAEGAVVSSLVKEILLR